MSEFFKDEIDIVNEEEIDADHADEMSLVIQSLRNMKLFQNQTEDDLLGLANQVKKVHLKAGESFLKRYETLNGVYILTEDAIVSEMNRYIPDQTRNGLFGGKECITGETISPTTATTTIDCNAWFISRESFIETIRKVPGLVEVVFMEIVRDLAQQLKASKIEKTNFQEQRRLTKEILEHMGVGSLSINQAGEIGPNYNDLAEKYLEKRNLFGLPFADVILGDDKPALRKYYQALQLLFSGNRIDPEIIISMLPKDVTINNRILQLGYSFVQDTEGNVSYVFVRMEDKTLERNLEKKEKMERKVINVMQANIGSYLSMLDDVSKTLDQVDSLYDTSIKNSVPSENDTLAAVMRSLHSSKGICGQHELSDLKTVIHNLEDEAQYLEKSEGSFDGAKFMRLIAEFKKELAYAVSFKDYLGADIINLLQGINFTKAEFELLLDSVKSEDHSETKRIVLDKILVSAGRIFDNWGKDIKKLSDRNGKQIEFSTEIEKGLKLHESIIHTLNVELGHIYRNCIDHGIELPEKRQKLGKNAIGKIGASVYLENDRLFLKISDDGAGFDKKEIIQIAKSNANLSQETVQAYIAAEEIWKILFLPGFSSSKKVTSTSGRGVGLDAVCESVKALNGKVRMASEKNKGSTFLIDIPLENNF